VYLIIHHPYALIPPPTGAAVAGGSALPSPASSPSHPSYARGGQGEEGLQEAISQALAFAFSFMGVVLIKAPQVITECEMIPWSELLKVGGKCDG
jgi:hypothetical protein